MPVGPPDPHAIGLSVGRLSGGAKRNGKICFSLLGSVLDDGEVVEALCVGRFHDQTGLCAVTGSRTVVLHEGPWKPEIAVFEHAAGLEVQGWADEKVAALVFTAGDRSETIDRIPDRALAQEIAQRVRGHVANS